MNNIYVDEVPDSCFYCDFFVKENYCCYLMQKDAREYRDDCPLIPITDRLAEERKKVVQEIRNYVCNKYTHIDEEIVNGNHTFFYSIHCRSFLKKLDQIERGK